jgi:glycosyltransferase involved in cell wall biosynthesis
LQLLLKALARIKQSDRPFLKVVGKGGRYEAKMKELVQQLKLSDDVEFKGRVEDVHLRRLYKQAMFTVYPSFYEGFGIPVIESMLMGTPVITSNVSSMPEAAAGIAELIDPNSVEDLEKAIVNQLNRDGKLSEEEREEIKVKFNPENHAQQVLALYREVLKC